MPSFSKEYFFLGTLFLSAIAFATDSKAISAVPACTSEQIEIAYLPEEGPYNGKSQDKATLFFSNISSADCTLPATPEIHFLDQDNRPLSTRHEKPEEYHFRRFPHKERQTPYLLQKKGSQEQSTAYTVLFWISAPVYAHGVCLTPKFIEVLLPNMKWQVPFENMICGVTDTPWYQESPLQAGTNIQKTYISALEGEPESPKSLKKGEEVIEASYQGQSAMPTP